MTTGKEMLFWTVCSLYAATDGLIQNAQAVSTHFVQRGGTANLTCSIGTFCARWYKERPDGGLWSNQSYSFCKYTRDPREGDKDSTLTATGLSLTINNVEASDSGVYYCTGETDLDFAYTNMLVIPDPLYSDPSLSILAPMQEQKAERGTVVLLCVVLGWTDKWSSVQWHLAGNVLESFTTIDPDGSIRSLIIIPDKRERLDPPYTCSIQERFTGKTINATLATEATRGDTTYKDCYIVLYVGLVLIPIFVLIHGIIFISRRRALLKGRVVSRMPETEMVVYAAVK
ncbi:hypothetical protein FKM82_016192 [Ascaphus truei]